MSKNPKDDRQYQVIFSGELLPGSDPDQVKADLAQLFKIDRQKIELFFTGKPVVVKSNIDGEMATKYEAAFKNAGAICRVSAQDEISADINSQEEAVSKQNERAAPYQSGAALTDVPAPSELKMAPVGARIGPQQRAVLPPKVDIEHLDMLPVGSDMVESSNTEMAEAPGTDHIALATGGGPLVQTEEVVVDAPNVEHLSVLTVGKLDLGEPEDLPSPPNVEHISVAPPGEVLETLPKAEGANIPNIAHLKMLPNNEA